MMLNSFYIYSHTKSIKRVYLSTSISTRILSVILEDSVGMGFGTILLANKGAVYACAPRYSL